MTDTRTDPAPLLAELERVCGTAGVIRQGDAMAPYLHERRDLFHGRALAVALPESAAAVAAVVRACHEAGVAVVPQGGNTGLCGGAAPDASATQVIVSLRRLCRIRAVDPANFTMTVESGCVLADLQRAADDADRLFPLSYAAEDQCLIGGNLSTNAGGMNVLRYGNARDLVLGVEVVLPDGRAWNGLRALRKDNSGYDLKDLFIGAEGTLGIVTAAVLKLYPRPRHHASALMGLRSAEDAVSLLSHLRTATGDGLTACELMGRTPVEFAIRHAGCREPFDKQYAWYVVADVTSSRLRDDLPGLLREALREAGDLVGDYRMADDADGRAELWRIRKSIPGAQKHEGGSIKHDISVPVSRIPEFLQRAGDAVTERLPDIRPCPFGHVGDGNIHFNLSQPVGADTTAFLARWSEFNRLVHDIVMDMDGSFAAEHGVGQLKPGEVVRLKSAEEVDLMRRVKQAIDPQNGMNPGKLIR